MPPDTLRFGTFGSSRAQEDTLTPYKPTPLEVQAELRKRQEEEDKDGWFTSVLKAPETAFGAHAIRGLVKGAAESGLEGALEGFYAGLPTTKFTDWVGITDHHFKETYTADVRKAFGDTNQDGWGNFALNFMGDVLTDPSSFLTLFGKTAKGLTAGMDIAAGLAQGIKNGERAALVFKFPFMERLSFGIPALDPAFKKMGFESLTLNVAEGLDSWASWMRTGPLKGVTGALTNQAIGIADPEQARAIKRLGAKMRGDRAGVEQAFLRVFAQTPQEAQEYLLQSPAAQRVVREMRERGIGSFDDAHRLSDILERPVMASIPVDPVQAADRIAGVGDLATPLEKKRADLVTSEAMKEVGVLDAAHAQTASDLDTVMARLKDDPTLKAGLDKYLLNAAGFMRTLGDKEMAQGILNGMFEFYVPRHLTPDAMGLINARFGKALTGLDGAGLNRVASFMKGRKFTDLTTIEANAIVRELGSKATGYVPLKDLAKQAEAEAGFFNRIFDAPFIKQLRKVDPEAGDFFSINPIYADFMRAKASGQALGSANFRRGAIRAISKGSLTAKDMAGNAEQIQRWTDAGYQAVVEGKGGRLDAVAEHTFVAERLGEDGKSRFLLHRDRLRDSVDAVYDDLGADHDKITGQLREAHKLGDFKETDLLNADLRILDNDTPAAEMMKSALIDQRAALQERNLVRAAREAVENGTQRGVMVAKGGKPLAADKAAFAREVEKRIAEVTARTGGDKKAILDDLANAADEAKERLSRAQVNTQAGREAITDQLADLDADYKYMVDSVYGGQKAAEATLKQLKELGTHGATAARNIRAYRQAARNGFLPFQALTPEQQASIIRKAPNTTVHFVDPKDYAAVRSYHEDLTRPDTLRKYGIVRGMDKLTGFWKAWTVGNIAFFNGRVRDVVTGFATLGMSRGGSIATSAVWDGHAAANVFKKSMAGQGTLEELGKGVVIHGVADQKFQTVDKVLTYLADNGVLDSGLMRDSIVESAESAVKHVGPTKVTDFFTTKIFSPNPTTNPFTRKGYEVANYGDNWVKITGFIDGLKRGETADQALDFIRANTYSPASNATSFMKTKVARVFPFGQFSGWAIGTTVRQFLTQPGTVSWIEKMQRNAALATGVSPDMEKILPDFVKDGLGVPYKNTANGPAYFLFGGYLPAAEVSKLASALEGIGKPVEEGKAGPLYRYIVGQLNPVAKLSIEALTNNDSFTGAEIEAYEGQSKEMFGVAMPAMAYQTFRQIRLLSEMDRLNVINIDQARLMINAVERGSTLGSRDELPFAERLVSSSFGVTPKSYQIDAAEQVRQGRREAADRRQEAAARLRNAVEIAPKGQKREANIEALRAELLQGAADAAQVEQAAREYKVEPKIQGRARQTLQFGRFGR